MVDDPHVLRIKQTRCLLLSNLNRMYPTPVQVKRLQRVMVGFDEHYDQELLKKDLTYLRQKAYIYYVDERIGGADSFEGKFVSLTAEGKEIADRTQTDKALEI